jgi:NADPH:quinone reductase-like Zn-dependent oxidoreductase
MKLIQFREPGPSTVLQCLDVPVPKPKPDEVLIRAHAIGVGMPDVLIRAGTYSFMPPLPATPGQELAGTIEKIGIGVTTRHPGQRVTNDRIAAAIMRNSSLRRQRRRISSPMALSLMPQRRSPTTRWPTTCSTMRCDRRWGRACSSMPLQAGWAMR